MRLSYCRGRSDAERVVREIVSHAGTASYFACDVQSDGDEGLADLADGWRPTHLYYFATPHITAGSSGALSTSRFRTFCDFYVTGFFRMVTQLRALSSPVKHIFYPSTVYLDDMPDTLVEYVLAKAAGEATCDFLRKHQAGLVVYRPRLPRLATDQTASLLPQDLRDGVSTILEHLRRFCEAS